MQKTQNSSFWFDETNDIDVLTGEKIQLGKDYIKLAATKRAIANFVQIVTGKNIPVNFSKRGDSYTDGKSVTISANLKDKDFDPAVGLALHEGSHILLTDFDTLKNIDNYIEDNMQETIKLVAEKYNFYTTTYEDDELVKTETIDMWTTKNYIARNLKDLLNIVEDRRIDNYVFKSAPGYKNYYHSMYNKYFNARVIDKALQSNEKTSDDWDSYFFRICNITNPNRNLDALPVLRKVWNTLNLKNIERLSDSWMALDVAKDIFNTVEESLPKPTGSEKENEDDTRSNESNCNGNGNCKNAKTPQGKESSDDGSKAEGGEAKISNGGNGNGPTVELTDAQKRQLSNAIKKQKEFNSTGPAKSKLSKRDEKIVEAISSSGSETKEVGDSSLVDTWRRKNTGKTDCIVVKNLTKELAKADVYNTFSSGRYWSSGEKETSIQKGFLLGKMLGRKLQIRNESNTLKYTRLQKGKIDKRLISSLGFGAENVFSQSFVEQFNNSVVHLSIDASGSMSGDKFNKAIIAAVAIAQAASMTNNFDVIISFRSTEDMGSKCLPAIFIAYDSRKHKVKRLSWVLKYMHATGITPEGLCFEAIMNQIDESTANKDSFFINFSDGEPYFENGDLTYYGEKANRHTKKQVDKMIAKGVKVLSYFIGSGYQSSQDNFKRMYGKDATFIQTNELVPLAKSLNKMFAEK